MVKRIRSGLYAYKGYLVEYFDERAERYPGSLDYQRWCVTTNGGSGERWLETFATLHAALLAIDDEIQKFPIRNCKR